MSDITYYVVECSEFHILGAWFEGISNILDALKTFEKVKRNSLLSAIPAIGVSAGDEEYNFFYGKRLDLDYIPEEIKKNKKFLTDMKVLNEYLANSVS